MRKIFILTGEPSGDKLASKVISEIKKKKSDLEFLSVGGNHLQSLGIKTIYDQKEITYIAFTDVIINFFKISTPVCKINIIFNSPVLYIVIGFRTPRIWVFISINPR